MQRIKAKHIIEILIHIAFWIGLYYTLISITSSSVQVQVSHNNKDTERMAINTVLPSSRFTLIFLALLFYGNIFWVFKWIIRHRRLSAGIAIAAGWFVLTFMANYFFIGPKITHSTPFAQRRVVFKYSQADFELKDKGTSAPPHDDTVRTGVRVAHVVPDPPPLFDFGNNTFRTQLTMLLVFLAVSGLSVAYFFLKEWGRNELARNQLEAYQLSTEIKFLKSQINPHFLFNTLNNLFSMAQAKGNDDLADGISKLSGMMRYMIYDSNAESVPLNKEIAYLEECITLNKLRYADNEAKVTFDYPAKPGGIAIAPMLFIPFVENAFKHGVAIGKTSAIDIALIISDQKLIFTCVNPKTGAKKMDDEKSGIGLENVKRRLELLYPDKHTLRISDDDRKYFVVLEIDLE